MKPYVKCWRSALQKSQPYKPRKISTPDECIQQKIRMAESLLSKSSQKWMEAVVYLRLRNADHRETERL